MGVPGIRALLHPVLREFYKERDVVMEERRMRTDSSPQGRLLEQISGGCVSWPILMDAL